MLEIYLDREAGSFAKRFRQTSGELHAAVGAVGSQVDQISAASDEKVAGIGRAGMDAEQGIRACWMGLN